MTIETLKAIYTGNVAYLNGVNSQENLAHFLTPNEKWNWLHKSLLSATKVPPLPSISALISFGVSADSRDCYGNSPLHYAARLKNVAIASILLNAGADVNAINLAGVTPLRESLLRKPYSRDLIKLFLSSGADFNRPIASGRSDLEYTKSVCHGEDADIILLFDVAL